MTENGQPAMVLLRSEQGDPHASLLAPKEWDCENPRYRMYDTPPYAVPPPVMKAHKEAGCWTSWAATSVPGNDMTYTPVLNSLQGQRTMAAHSSNWCNLNLYIKSLGCKTTRQRAKIYFAIKEKHWQRYQTKDGYQLKPPSEMDRN